MVLEIDLQKKMPSFCERMGGADQFIHNESPVLSSLKSVENSPFSEMAVNFKGDVKLQEEAGSIFDKKMDFYREYHHYGYNPVNVSAIPEAFDIAIKNNFLKYPSCVEMTEKINTMLPLLHKLAATILTEEDRKHLPNKRVYEINKQENIVRRLLTTIEGLPVLLQKAERQISLPEDPLVRNALADELIESVLTRLPDGRENEKWRQELKMKIFSATESQWLPKPEQEQIKYFFDHSLAELQGSIQKELQDEIRKIKTTADAALRFIATHYRSAGKDFVDTVSHLVKILDNFLNRLENDCVKKKIIKPLKERGRGSCLNKTVLLQSGKKMLDKVQHTPHSARIKLDRMGKNLKTFFPRDRLDPFLGLSLEDKQTCLAMKKRVAPLQDNALLIQQAASRLKEAINDASYAGVSGDLSVTTLEEALSRELMMLTTDTPKTRFISTVQTAKAVAKQVLSDVEVKALASTNKQDPYSLFIQENAKVLILAAESLLEGAEQGETHFSQNVATAELDYAKKTAGRLQDIINKGLESVTGISLYDGDEWLHKLNAEIQNSWQGLTELVVKSYRPYLAFREVNANDVQKNEHFNAVHCAVFPLLNETEKLRIASEELEAVLSEKVNIKNQHRSAVEKAAKKCREIDPENLRLFTEELGQQLRKRDITISQCVMGNITGTTLAKQLNLQAEKLMEATETLHHVAWLAEWVPANKQGKVIDILTMLQSKMTSIKVNIKNVVEAGTGTRLHNNPVEGMIAKDAGEWLVKMKNEWRAAKPDASPQEWGNTIEPMLEQLAEQFSTDDDPEGKLFRLRVELAMKDAEKGGIPWVPSAEQQLARVKSNKDYTLEWAEKRLTYGVVFNLLAYRSLMAMLSPYKNIVASPLRMINLLLTPVRKEITIRAMKKVRPGNSWPAEQLDEYRLRENYQAAFRILSILSPQLLKTVVASGVLSYGLIKGGEYRDEFLSRALHRVRGDLFWSSLFTGWQQWVDASGALKLNEKYVDAMARLPDYLAMLENSHIIVTTGSGRFSGEPESVMNIAEPTDHAVSD
ncbi:hypothetical protein [Erwinia psidii]|uniref:Uncharacterized protein n=1 Tax=Erwinia psidii TaxID=69224 RepID=A0A3N6S2Y5_9GAMM|nr:hypothetical protein [Erwinia psidii]MCX8956649.1 hypothetical protein [Erwinia psidii]RQM39978.1 hypothetical protein EB241_01315 [Erwinia psidii]